MNGREQQIIAAAIERGEAIPTAIVDRPEVWAVNRAAWDGFWTLRKSGPLIPMGMGGVQPGHIAYESMSRYAFDHGEADDVQALDDFIYLVQRCDDEWMKIHASRQPKQPQKK